VKAKLKPGCYVDTEQFGEAICTELTSWGIHIRYEAKRCSDQKTIWVANGVRQGYYRAIRPPDDVSLAVLKLKGPYGEDDED